MRATRDRWRRRWQLMHKRAELLAHSQNTPRQYKLPEIGKKRACQTNRAGGDAHFPASSVRKTIELAVALLGHDDKGLGAGKLSLTPTAKGHAVQTCSRGQSGPGSGKILALVLLYEIHASARFPRVQDFGSSCRRGKCATESAGKRRGSSGKKGQVPRLTGLADGQSPAFCLGWDAGTELFKNLLQKKVVVASWQVNVLAPSEMNRNRTLLTRTGCS